MSTDLTGDASAGPVTIEDLLVKLGAYGIELRRAGTELKVRGAVPPGLVPHLRAHKDVLLDIAGERWWSPARRITPAMLPLVELTQAEVDAVVATVDGGAANVADIYPLAPLQDGVLFHHLVSEGADPYLMSLTYAFDTAARLAGWVRAFDAVVARHDVLRTAVVWRDLPTPVQVVWRRAGLPVTEVDLEGAAEPAAALRAIARTHAGGMDLGRAPLARLVTARDGDRVLAVLLLHHLVADHVTLEVVLSEISAHLRGAVDALPDPVPFRTFVATARGDEDAQRAFFTGMLADVTEPTAPFGVLSVTGDGTGVTETRARVDDAVAARLRARATALGVSAAALCHLAWAHVLARLTGRADVVFGTVLFGRTRGGDGADRAVGPFINTLPVRVRVGPGVPAEARAVHGALTDLMRHEHASLALAQRCGGVPAPAPLFTTILNYRHSAAADLPAEDGITPLHGEERTNYPLTLSVDDLGGGFGVTVQAVAGVDADRVARYVHTALAAVAAGGPDAVDVLPAAERDLLTHVWNDTATALPDVLVHELVARQQPDAVAVVHGDDRLTYGELNTRANRLAWWLREQGVRPDDRVAVLLPRGTDQIVAVLGVLRAGAGYVPLDPGHPRSRTEATVADAAPAVTITGATLAAVNATTRDGDPGAPERAGLTARHLAYVIYTSGSTGRPKGVEVEHAQLAAATLARARFYPHTRRFLLLSSLSFDSSVAGVFGTLTTGGVLVVATDPRDPAAVAADVARHAVDTLLCVPSLYRELVPALTGVPALATAIVAGEPCPPELVTESATRLPAVTVVNEYGPTEATVWATAHRCVPGEAPVPIGVPVANVRVYVVDGQDRPAPVGVAGELLIGGAGVARGYLGRPAETGARFGPDPFVPGGRVYRTGDRARRRADGVLEFLGRTDRQVQVRGHRVEPGEVEAALSAYVRESVVVARDDRLVAYVVDGPDAAALRTALADTLPGYLVPAAFVHLDALPRTANGKVDHAALPAVGQDAVVRDGHAEPAGRVERAVADVWAEVLGLARISRDDSFFALGGHSLTAIRVAARLRVVLGVDPGVATLLDHPVLADLAAALAALAPTALAPITPVPRGGDLPPSAAQRGLWLTSKMDGADRAYRIGVAMRLAGDLDDEALRKAMDALVARHETLRTTFTATGGQRIGPPTTGFTWTDDLDAPFDLATGPLVRGRLDRTGPREWTLTLAMHHIVSDAWSAGVLLRELGVLYRAIVLGAPDPLPPLPVQYADYAAWQAGLLAAGQFDAHAGHWLAALTGAPELSTLPADRPRPARPDHHGAFAPVALDADLSAKVRACALRHATTPFVVLFAAWAAVLSRLSGQHDVVVGAPSANRGRAETEELIGFFVTMLPIRLDTGAEPTTGEWLRQVHDRVTAAQAHQDLPFDRIVELVRPVRVAGSHPLFQVAFTWQAAAVDRLDLPGVTATPLPPAGPDAARFDLTLALADVAGRVEGGAEYSTALFDHETVERYLRCWRTLLAALLTDDGDTGLSRLPLLTPAEEAVVLSAGTGPVLPDDRADAGTTAHALVERWVRRTPDAVAVEHGADQVTYAELDTRAGRLAARLRARGIGPGDLVGLLLPPGADLVVAILGVLKAGAAYLPLDPAAPGARTRALLTDVAPAAVLTGVDLAGGDGGDGTGAPVAVGPHDLAYVVHTSGSTGAPKGVLVEHGNLLAMTLARVAEYGPLGRAVLAVPAHFDAAAAVVFGTLATGGTLVVADHPVAGLAELVRDRRVTTLLCVASVLRALVPGLSAPTLRLVLTGGEPLPPGLAADLARRHPDVTLVNEYGPSETTIWATRHRCVPGEQVVPVGSPVANVRISVRDPHGVPVPFGVVGEVHIGGAGVARGYLNRPELTAAAFVDGADGRRYRTGDLGRLRPDGVLELLGRADEQVKVRGVRVEPGEVEAALLRHPGVAAAVVVARGQELVAYHTGRGAEPAQLRAHLAALLPDHMVPAAYVPVAAMPLTASGKLDRAALPAPPAAAYARRGHVPPEGEVETVLAREWAALLGTDQVGRDDNFFDLGGHSLVAVTLVDRLRANGLATTVTAVITTPTLRHLAETVTPAAAAGAAPPPAVDPDEVAAVAAAVPGGAANVQDVYPLAPLQEGVLYDHLRTGGDDPYLMSLTFVFESRERLDAHVRALQAVVDRHDVLRTAILWEDLPEPRQVVWRHARVPVDEVAPDSVGRVARIDVRRAPLLRLTVARDGDTGWLLGLHLHHLVGDHGTLEVLQQEMAAHLAGRAGELPTPVPFREFVDHLAATGDPAADDAFFTALLGDVDEPTAPFGPLVADRVVEHHTWLPADLAGRLRVQTRRAGVGAAALWHQAWALVLARLTDRADVVFGTVLAGRANAVPGAVGPFVNTLPLRLTVDGRPAHDAVVATHALLAELLRHEHASLARAQRCAAVAAPEPLFTTLFNYRHDTDVPAGRGPVAAVDRTAYPITVSVDESPHGFAVTTQAPEAARVGGYLLTAVGELVTALESGGTPLDALDVLPPEETAALLASDVTVVPGDGTVHGLFAAAVRAHPGAVAVVDGDTAVTYAELAAGANRVAHALLAKGVRPGDRVGVSLGRGADLVAALLGVLAAGAAYVPLDPGYPAARLAFVTGDCGLTAVVDHVPCDGPAHDPGVVVSPSDAAYVIYTSGSTGRPKGVVVEHRNVVRLFGGTRDLFGFGRDDVWSWCHSFAFDFSVWEIFGALVNGGRLVVVPGEVARSPAALLALVRSAGVTVLSQTPGAFREFVATQGDEPHRLRHVVLGGEALDPTWLLPWFSRPVNRDVHVTNMYGITETTVHVTVRRITTEDALAGGCPIGRPLPDLRVHVLDRWGRPAPVGVVGEMYVGGAGVARGYHDRPALTAERFVPDPFTAGERLYRTGDLAVRHADGSLGYAGRGDAQVKVRGFRVEPGEVEAVLTAHDRVHAAVVLLGGDALVAYVIGDATAAELRAHATRSLPGHLVPAAYVRVDRFPLTVNGKLDRAALPAPDDAAVAHRDYEPPAGEVETAIAGIWAELLGQDRVGRDDNFFDLGGHSVLAVRLLSRVRARFGVDLTVDTAFHAPVLADYAAAVTRAAPGRRPPVTPADRTRPLPMSFAQRRLWFLSTMDGASAAYHIDLNLRLSGDLDERALRAAFDTVVARHDALRTTFAQAGEPVQVVAPTGRFTWTDDDGPFDLARGPLVRGRLTRVADRAWLLSVTMHHIVADGWSLGVLAAELGALYAAYRDGRPDPLPPLAVQYPDYAVWQHEWLSGEELKRQADFWQRTLSGAPGLCELPTDRPRPAYQDFAGAAVECVLDRELTDGLRALGARHGATLYVAVLATWAALLQRLSGQSEVVVGTPAANRGGREVEDLIGFFVNMLPLRLDGAGTPTLAEWLARVRATTVAAQNHQEMPFERIVELVAPARSLAHNAVFQVAFAWQAEPERDIVLPGVTVERVTGTRHTTSRFDLTLSLAEEDGELRGGIEYATALFDRTTVERFLRHWRTLVAAFVAAGDDTPVAALPLLTDAERARVIDAWNDTSVGLPVTFLHELVAAQAKRTPTATAVVAGAGRLTYAELDARANRLAHHLVGLGAGPGNRVVVALERGVDMVVAVLGVLKAGAAYVPLDPAHPAGRLRTMVADCDPVAVVAAHPPEWTDRVLVRPGDPDGPDTPPVVTGCAPDDLAYVIYTSGSTGTPKGVMISHAAACNTLLDINARHHVGPDDVVLALSSLSFDLSVYDLFGVLAAGGRVVLPPPGRGTDPVGWQELVAEHGVTVWNSVPALAQLFAESASGAVFPTVRLVMMSGDWIPVHLPARLRACLPAAELHSYGGATEASIWSVTYPIDPTVEYQGSIPYGRALANQTVYVLDPVGAPCPVGVEGDLVIGGVGVALGYIGRPELTAERFPANPFHGGRMYRTGDRARWRVDGNLEFLGRADLQVKVRGFRIELGEVEAALLTAPDVREAVVVVREDTPGDRRLVAYTVGAPGPDALRTHLTAVLPEYMVPAVYVRLDTFPLSANGKVDRAALPAPAADATAGRGSVPPRGPVETAIAGLWQELLGVAPGRDDNFFALGGHSLLAMTLLDRMRAIDLHADVRTLFATATLADLAAATTEVQEIRL